MYMEKIDIDIASIGMESMLMPYDPSICMTKKESYCSIVHYEHNKVFDYFLILDSSCLF